MTFAIGENVGPYRITDRLGQGGMATVFRAYHAKLDRYVAIKVLHPAFKEDASFIERFQREAKIVARLEHPNIVPIYDSDEQNGQPYLVMKFIDGATLKNRLGEKRLMLPETLHLMTAVGQALTYAHEQGILHRDIKPSNILIDKNGEPYLADFGLARMASAGESTLSQDMMLGTPQYISPEQAQGAKDLDAGTDIYSLGVVLYELLVGRVPFSADTPYAIVHDHIYAPLPLPSKVNPQVPPSVEQVLLRALAKDRRDRYASAVQMVEAFRKAVEEADLKELSAGSYRVPTAKKLTDTADLMGATSIVEQSAYDKQGQASDTSILPSTPLPAAVPTPGPDSASAARQASQLRRRKQQKQQRANLWILGGFTGLIVTCLTGMIITVSTVTDPTVRNSLFVPRPSDSAPFGVPPHETAIAALFPTTGAATAAATSPVTARAATQAPTASATQRATQPATSQPTSPSTATFSAAATNSADATATTPLSVSLYSIPDLPFAEAQALVDRDGNNPVNWFALAQAAGKDRGAGRAIKAEASLIKAIELAGTNEPLILSAARSLSDAKLPTMALYVYARMLTLGDPPKVDRDEATHFLYKRASGVKAVAEVAPFDQINRAFPTLAEGYAYGALASWRASQPDDANAAISKAARLDPSNASVLLVQGIIDLEQNKTVARQELENARAMSGAAPWLVDEATALLKKGSS